MRCIQSLFIALFLTCPAFAQHYVGFGVGFAGGPNNSDDLESFKESYNWVNDLGLTSPFDGFQLGLGLRPELNYRYWGKWTLAASAGYFRLVEKDFANFSDGASRQLELTTSSAFGELELGRTFGYYFLSGIVSFYPGRISRLESNYLRPPEADDSIELNGSYKSERAWAADLGLHFGYLKAPVLLSVRLTYPVVTSGSELALIDGSTDKMNAGIAAFPSDYVNFVQGNSYDSISGDIDGFKIILGMAYSLQLFK